MLVLPHTIFVLGSDFEVNLNCYISRSLSRLFSTLDFLRWSQSVYTYVSKALD